MSGAGLPEERDTPEQEPRTPECPESSTVGDAASLDPLFSTDLRTLTPEALQLLAATGC
ncbi:MAG TPA: hypothetical protein VL131_13475 [Gammaproteobacteria bacterium]|nr:hypothetical protein [Gammaproteobacteria bacterium]